ncbi:MAG TPA: hypothetical protein VHN15_07795 [Thermoanaerobaculia bacterium]|nr:hypothetical protein [Thermoanaerobaculia bacterium]
MFKHGRVLAIGILSLFLLAQPGQAEGGETAESYLSQLWGSLVSLFDAARGDFDPWGVDDCTLDGRGELDPDGGDTSNARGDFDPWGVDPES